MASAVGLAEAISKAFDEKRRAAPSLYIPSKKLKSSECSIESCSRPEYAKGYCVAHYGRIRKGQDMDSPLVARKRGLECVDCGGPIDAHGGWGRCSKHFKRERFRTIKGIAIEMMGGVCSVCGGSFPPSCFDFHHTGNKAESPSYIMSSGSAKRIEEELSVCVLVCANCHRKIHNAEGSDNE